LHVLQAVLPGQPLSPAHCASDVHGTTGCFQVGAKRAAQNPQNTKGWPGRSADVALDVPVVRANGMGSMASGPPAAGGSQSWLVGNASLMVAIVPGVQAWPSFGPPLHSRVVGLQIGHGWIAALSSAHVPPGQSASVLQLRPTLLGSVVAVQRLSRTSPVRYVAEASWKSTLAAPVSHRAVPLADPEMVLMTQLLRLGFAGMGIGSGAPKKQPSLVQSRLLPVSAPVALASCNVLLVQLATLNTESPLSGFKLGGTPAAPPPM